MTFEIWSSQWEKHWRQGIFIHVFVRFFSRITVYPVYDFCSVNERSNVKKIVSKSLLGGPHKMHVHFVL